MYTQMKTTLFIIFLISNIAVQLVNTNNERLAIGGASIFAAEQNPNDSHWDNSLSPSFQGVSGWVNAFAFYDGKLIIAGSFKVAGNVLANNIAAWDGLNWYALGTGTDTAVNAIAVWNDQLVIGGDFTEAGGIHANHVAVWNGSSWDSLGVGLNNRVNALTVYGTKIIAGGWFTLSGGESKFIAAWDGSSWTPMQQGMDYAVRSLTVYRDTLIAGGDFSSAGSVSASYIAAWDGAHWSSLGAGTDAQVYALLVKDDQLIAGGEFTKAGGWTVNHVAAWNGTSWAPLGQGMTGAFNSRLYVGALTIYGDKLVAGGSFLKADGGLNNCVAIWSGAAWLSLANGTSFAVHALTTYHNSLTAGTGGISGGIAVFDSTSWIPLTPNGGTNCTALTVTAQGENLYFGGYFAALHGRQIAGLAEWNGTSWSQTGESVFEWVSTIRPDGDSLLVGGNPLETGIGSPIVPSSVCSWNGSSWVRVGQTHCRNPYAFATLDTLLVVGGYNDCPENQSFLEYWSGTSWFPFFKQPPGVMPVRALTIYDGHLVANQWYWDGFNWQPFGLGLNGRIYALAEFEGKLIAGGSFAGHIAAWNGSSWTTLGAGLNDTVFALSTYNGRLIAGGSFTQSGAVAANRIAAWNGSSWDALGSGVDGKVVGLTVYQNHLVTCGGFLVAGGKVAVNIATWTDPSTAVIDISGSSLPEAYRLQQNYPNPFNPETTLEFDNPRPSFVSLDIYDILGRHVRTLVNEWLKAGAKRVVWNGRDDASSEVPSGVYLYQLKTGDISESKKMVLLK